jgi:hypothetical protein
MRAPRLGLTRSRTARFGGWAAAMSALFLIGCASGPRNAAFYEIREAPTGIEAGEAISLMLKSRTGPDRKASATEKDRDLVAACVERGAVKANSRLSFERQANAPSVRYVVRVEAHTLHSSKGLEGNQGGIGVVWLQLSRFSAEVFDARHDRIVGSVVSSDWGGEGVGLALIIPFGFWSNSEAHACEALGKGIARLVSE